MSTDSHLRTDLVIRLRSFAREYGDDTNDAELLRNAAGEIERLRAQLRQIDAVETTPHTPAQMKVGIMAALARQGLT